MSVRSLGELRSDPPPDIGQNARYNPGEQSCGRTSLYAFRSNLDGLVRRF